MKIIDCQQGSLEWLLARSQCATASELENLITPKLKIKTGEGPHTYLCRKLAERWLSRPIATFSGGAMEQGSILEEEAIPYYELRHKCTVRRVGFITSDSGELGCSPDGLLDKYGLEIKCPQEHTHMKWLLGGGCPEEHYLQVQGGMAVTGLAEWEFMSYCRNMPPLIVRVARDEKAQEVIAKAVAEFADNIALSWAVLVAEHGEPPRRERPAPAPSSGDEEEFVF